MANVMGALEPSTSREATLDRRLHDLGWGLLFILTGAVSLVPAEQVPEGTWLLGVAGILLGVNALRLLSHIRVSGFSLILGLLALAAGLSRMLGVDLPLLAICLLAIGVSLVVKPWVTSSAH